MPSIEVVSVGNRKSLFGVEFRMAKRHLFQIPDPISVILGNPATSDPFIIDVSDVNGKDVPQDLIALNGKFVESIVVSLTPEEVAACENIKETILHHGVTDASMTGIGQRVKPDQAGMRLQIIRSLD